MKKRLPDSEIYEGYFSKLFKDRGDGFQSFKFSKNMLNQYTDLSIKNPMEFKIQEKNGIYWIEHMGKWGIKCNINRDGSIGAILPDLADIPKDQQQWWVDHLIEESED